MKYVMYVKAEEYVQIEAADPEEAHDLALELAPQVARNWQTEIVREFE